MKHVYLDWNVFNKIEYLESIAPEEQITFSGIKKLIENQTIICPYSNAHINDLLRGHAKDPSYISGHLETLKKLTGNLCIVQYWGQEYVTWHYREVSEFFNSGREERKFSYPSFVDLMIGDNDPSIYSAYIKSMREKTVPSNFKELYKADPIFKSIYPRTRIDMNFLSLCEDIHAFSQNAQIDHSLYKSLRRFIVQTKAKLRNESKTVDALNKALTTKPEHLIYNDSWEEYSPKKSTSTNSEYQKITNTYIKIDLKGIKSDERFANLIDDALHTFYGAHCDYFITSDDRCYYKAIETYKILGIKTQVVKPENFTSLLG